eukprot:m.138087 g.138087  ORF g.138087 m.138087 type:complete len:514 (-) comp11478_c0_seq1:74-1615(-)
MKVVTSIAVVLAVLHEPARAAKIVWLPFPGGLSHVMIAAKTLRELGSRGHDVNMVVADVAERNLYEHVDTSGVSVVRYDWDMSREEFITYMTSLATTDPISSTIALAQMDADKCLVMLSTESVTSKIADADLIIVDAASRCGSVTRDYLGIRHRVDFLPLTFSDPFFLPRLGAYSPLHSVPQLGSRLSKVSTLGDRVHNTITYVIDKLIERFVADRITNDLRAKLNLSGSHAEAMCDHGMLISQSSWAFEFPTSLPPTVKLVGPILPSPGKPLPSEINDFVTASTATGWGTVIVSFGSQTHLPQDMVDKMASAFALLNGSVLWKPPHTSPTMVPSNVKLMNWIPQNDLLAHPNVRAFLSHGGLNGVGEAAYHGVPVIGFPLFADQWDNIARLEHRGMAFVVDSHSFTAESLAADITKVVQDPSFKANARHVSSIVQDMPKTSTKLAADWVEYALRHDGALFQKVPWPVHVPWYAAGGYDVLVVLVVVPALVLQWGCRRCCGGGKQGQGKTKEE